jgi:hypothetical protein
VILSSKVRSGMGSLNVSPVVLRNAEESKQMLRGSDFDRLRPRHQLFVSEFLIDCNATAAYKRTGCYRARGHAAEVNASRLRRRPDVKRALAERFAAMVAAVNAREAARRGPV